MSAELMVPKWFDQNPALGVADTVAELRRSLEIACDLYLGRGDRATAFGHHASRIGEQVARCAAEVIGRPSVREKRVSVRVDIGGARSIKKKKRNTEPQN